MPTLHVHVWAKNTGIGLSHWAAQTMGIWKDKGGSPTQRIDIKVRERVWEKAQSMDIINKQGAGPQQWNLPSNCCVTRISDPEFQRPLWKWFNPDRTNCNGENHKASPDKFAYVGIRRRKNWLQESPTWKWNLVHIGMYFIGSMLLLLFLMMC